MEIKSIETVSKLIPFADSFPVSYEEHRDTEHLFVRIQTDGDEVGYGEGTALPWFTGETADGMRAVADRWIAHRLLGLDPGEALSTLHRWIDDFPSNPGAKAAIELALLDLQGKRYNVPIRELFGPSFRSTLPLIYPIPGVDVDRATKLVEDGVSKGFERFKVKATGDLQGDVDRIEAVIAGLPEEGTIRIDPNTGWRTATTTGGVIDRLSETAQIEYLEQPTDPDREGELRRASEATGLPVFADEAVHGERDIIRLGLDHGVAGCHLKLAKSGSLLRLSSMADLANRVGLSATPVSALGTSLEATAICHLAATVREIPLACELDPGLLSEDPVEASLEMAPEIPVPSEPGIGIDLDDRLFHTN